MSSTNTRAGRPAQEASGKRKVTGDEVGSSMKRVALELFPAHPEQNELNQVSQSPPLHHDANVGLNILPVASLLKGGDQDYHTNVQSVPLKTQEDPCDRLFKSQYEKMRETCKQYLNDKYNDLLRQAEERASWICWEKDTKIAHLKSKISCFQEKLASQNEVIYKKTTELDNRRRRTKQLEEQVANYKSVAEDWKKKVLKAEEIMWNATVSKPGHGACRCEDKEDTVVSSVGETRD